MKKFNSKKLFYSTGSVIITVVVIAIVILFNFLVSALTTRFSLKYDFTQAKLYHLSDDTKEFMKKVDKPIDLYYFVDDVAKNNNLTETLEKMAALNKNVSFRVVSADKEPALAQRFTTATSKLDMFTTVVDGGDTFKSIAYDDCFVFNPMTGQKDILILESKVVSAINTVLRGGKITVGFTTGHGEDQAAAMKTFLKDDNIKYVDVSLITDEFKTQCDMLVIAAPLNDFTPDEIDRLDSYIKTGGKVQLYFTYGSQPMPKLYAFLNECGITVGENLVIEGDASMVVGNAAYNFVASLNDDEITKNLIENNITNVVQMSKTVAPIQEAKDGFYIKTLHKTSSKGIATNIATSEEEQTGELSLSVIAEYTDDNGNGGALFVSGSYVSFAGSYAEYNKDFFLSNVIYMSETQESYSISPKILSLKMLNISQLSIILWMLVVVYIFPAIVFIAGIFVWYRRRHL